MREPATTAEWAQVIVQLEEELHQTDAAMVAAEAQRAPLALPARLGDEDKRAALTALEHRSVELRLDMDRLRHALAEARSRQQQAQDKELALAQKAKRAKLRKAAEGHMQLAAQFDAAAKDLSRVMSAYGASVYAMQRLGLSDTVVRKLRNRLMIAGSLHLAGLTGAIPLPSVSRHHQKTSVNWCGDMLRDLVEKPQAPPVLDAPVEAERLAEAV